MRLWIHIFKSTIKLFFCCGFLPSYDCRSYHTSYCGFNCFSEISDMHVIVHEVQNSFIHNLVQEFKATQAMISFHTFICVDKPNEPWFPGCIIALTCNSIFCSVCNIWKVQSFTSQYFLDLLSKIRASRNWCEYFLLAKLVAIFHSTL